MTTNYDLNKKLKNVKCFIGSFARDKLPKVKSLPAALIINTDTSTQPGEHWVDVSVFIINAAGKDFTFGKLSRANEPIKHLTFFNFLFKS